MGWFERTRVHWVAKVLGVWILMLFVALLSSVGAGDTKVPYVPEIIESEQPHAWCYVLKNDQSGAVGDINMLFCVPKGHKECNCDLLSLEELEGD
jgi:hypothetical protein